ncbi:TonB-dependent receptor [Tsuneonella mangrovi]|uniref:TonB-dependent receptor n=1 Tax=Tsuneonella mangrovi TaxID=1982042 RepID=UPI0030B80D0C
MRSSFGRSTAFILLASTSVLATPALAQSTTPAKTPAATDNVDANEIIVTAQKRSQSLQDVPISIQALTGTSLKDHQVADFSDYAALLPSVSYQSYGPGQSQIYFRGVSSGANANGSHSGPQPTSAMYVDEVPLTTIGGAPDMHVYDVARVEALSGPQGTLYGASSLSGTLRVITNQPNPNRFEASFDATGTTLAKGANSSGGTIEGMINVPLSERIALRTSMFYERDGGYISNTLGTRSYDAYDINGNPVTLTYTNAKYVKKNFNDVETWGGRAALGIDLDDNWTVTPSIIYQNQTSHGTFLFDPKVGDLQVHDFTPDYGTDEWYQAALTIKGKIGSWDLTYAGGYFERQTDLTQDYSYYTVSYVDNYGPSYASYYDGNGNNVDPTQVYRGIDKYSKLSQEVRISSPSENRWHLIAGLFYERQTDKIHADYIVPGFTDSLLGPPVPKCGDDIFCTRVYRVDRDYAAFADGSYDILDNLTLDAGIRYFKTKNSLGGFSGFAGTVSSASCTPTAASDPVPCTLFDFTTKDSGETHKVSLTWKMTPDAMLYGTYSTGYRPGGINRRAGVPPYRPDTLSNYEIGVKTQWLDRHLTINLTAFQEEWHDIQFGLAAFGSNGVISTYNAGNARIKGLEGDFSLRMSGFSLSGSATYIDAYLTTPFCQIDTNGLPNCTDPNYIATPAGTKLPTQPDFKGNLTARYDFPVGSANAFVQGTLNHQSGTRSYLTVDPYSGGEVLPNTQGFTSADFSLGMNYGTWKWSLFLTNAFDERGVLSLNTVCVPSLCGAYARAYPIKPRTLGLSIGYKY